MEAKTILASAVMLVTSLAAASHASSEVLFHVTFDDPEQSMRDAATSCVGTADGAVGVVPGTKGRALNLDQGGHVTFDLTKAPAFALGTRSFTVELMVRRARVGVQEVFLSKKKQNFNPAYAGFAVGVEASNKAFLVIWDGKNKFYMNGGNLNDMEWHRLVFVVDRESPHESNIYIDGRPSISDKWAARRDELEQVGSIDNNVPLLIGAFADLKNPFFGQVDEVKISLGTKPPPAGPSSIRPGGSEILGMAPQNVGAALYARRSNRQRRIATDGLEFLFDLEKGYISDVRVPCEDIESRGVGGLYFLDGETGEFKIPQEISLRSESERELVYRVATGVPDVGAEVRVVWDERAIRWTVDLANTGERDRFVEVRLGLPVVCRREMMYWDGHDGLTYDYPDKTGKPAPRRIRTATASSNMCGQAATPSCRRPGADIPPITRPKLEPAMLWVFPVNLLFNDRYSLALGADPRFLMSYYTGGVQPTFSSFENFYYALKFVLQPGDRKTQGFVIYSVQTDGFGYRPAMDRYYRVFPEQFTLRADADPRVRNLGCGIGPRQLDEINDLWQEYARRFNIGWLWYYVGHLRTGDFYPSDESPAAAARRETNRRGAAVMQRASILAQYCIPQRCEVELARSKFPDSIKIDHDGKQAIEGAVMPGETLYTMFPGANSYGAFLKENLWKVIASSGMEGIAFDNCFASDLHFGEGAKVSNGAAFTNTAATGKTFDTASVALTTPKAYSPGYLGYADIMDYLMNRARREGRRFSIIGNNPWSLATAIRCDSSYLEWHWHHVTHEVGVFEQQRYLLGGKRTISYKIAGRDEGPNVPPEQLNLSRHMRRFSLLFLFRYGAYPTMRPTMGAGDPDMLDAIPTLSRLCHAGWQAVSGVRHPGTLWVERFGEGPFYLSVVNHTPEDVTSTLRIENRYFGQGYRWFYPGYGDQKEVLCKSGKGITEIAVSVPAIWVGVYASNVALLPTNPDATLTGKMTVARERLEISIAPSVETGLRVRVELPEGSYDAQVRCAGQPISGRTDGALLEFALDRLPAGTTSDVSIEYKERVRADSQTAMLDFPFLAGDEPACEIVAAERMRGAAESLQRYFTYFRLQGEFGDWFQGKPGARIPAPDSVSPIPVAPAVAPTGTNCVVIGPRDFVTTQLKSGGVDAAALPTPPADGIVACLRQAGRRQFLAIVLGADATSERFKEFLALLDEKYVTQPGYHRGWGKRMTVADRGLLRTPVEGQPAYGWYGLLKRLDDLQRSESGARAQANIPGAYDDLETRPVRDAARGQP